eukprot:scaffold37835_cov246-Skeletonema_marinoi.AAC.2
MALTKQTARRYEMALTKQTARKSTGGKPPPPAVFMEREQVGGWLFQINCGKGLKWRQLCDQRPCASYPIRDLAQAIVAQEYQRNRSMGRTTAKKKISTSPSSPPKWKWSAGSRVLSTIGGSKVREQFLDLVPTQVEGVYIGFCTKSWTTGEASYLFPMEKGLNDNESGMTLAKDWKYVFAFLSRRDIDIDDGTTPMKAKRGSKWDWKVVVVVINDDSTTEIVGRHIANCFSKFTKNKNVMDSPEKYTYRQCYADNPKALNHYLLDMDVAMILKSLVYESGGYTSKKELIKDEEILTAFYGTNQFGKEYLEAMHDEDWENLCEGF